MIFVVFGLNLYIRRGFRRSVGGGRCWRGDYGVRREGCRDVGIKVGV